MDVESHGRQMEMWSINDMEPSSSLPVFMEEENCCISKFHKATMVAILKGVKRSRRINRATLLLDPNGSKLVT